MAATKRIKLEVPAGERVPDVGERYHGALVVASFPEVGSPNIVVETDDTAILPLHAVDLRPEHTDYGPVDATALYPPLGTVGDTYPEDAILARGNYGAGIIIGIVDTGLHRAHVAFDGCDVDTDDANDSHGHGSHVAATAASNWGIAKRATIIARAGIAGGSGSESSIANAIRQVIDAGAQVLSLSLGGAASSVMDAACEYARSRGCIVVCAAGNTAGAAIGSPARAADVIVLACDRERRYASFTSGTGWPHPNRVTDFGTDIWSAQAGTRDVARAMSGTSMACPHTAGRLAVLLGGGHSRAEALQYLWAHRSSPPTVGVPILTPDFGGVPAPPPDPAPDWRIRHREKTDELRAAVRLAQATRPPWDAGYETYRERMATIMDRQIGPIADMADQLDGIAAEAGGAPAPDPPPDPGEPPPPAPTVNGFGGSYPGHDPAFDAYPNGTCGPHLGVPWLAPSAGTVERYSFTGPLTALGAAVEHEMNGAAYGIRTPSPEEAMLFATPCAVPVHALGTSMHIMVFRPDAPLALADGSTLKALWLGHVQAGFRTGRVNKGDVLCLTGESGIEFGNGTEAAHAHVCGSRGGNLTPNGDVPGELVARLFGTVRNVGRVPGPSEYQAGTSAAYRGHLGYAAWQQACSR